MSGFNHDSVAMMISGCSLLINAWKSGILFLADCKLIFETVSFGNFCGFDFDGVVWAFPGRGEPILEEVISESCALKPFSDRKDVADRLLTEE